MDIDYLKIFVTITLAIIGWVTAHYFTSKRDITNKRREMTIEHLVSAYQILTHEVSHRDLSVDRRIIFENILSNIQLFGSIEQVELAKQLADDAAASDNFQLDPLINSLRNDLRSQLKLSSVEGNVKWLRTDVNNGTAYNKKMRADN